jgi:hypothetical protein
MPFKRKGEIEIAGQTLTVDAENVERIAAASPWKMQVYNTPVFYREIGPANRPYQELLAAFILGTDPGVYVEQIKPGIDYRKSNLRVSPRSAIKQKARG